jgi:hypothetical protein
MVPFDHIADYLARISTIVIDREHMLTKMQDLMEM